MKYMIVPIRNALTARFAKNEGINVIFTNEEIPQFEDEDIVWNWGSQVKNLNGGILFNPPNNIPNASNQVKCTKLLEGLCPPTWYEYSTDIPLPFVAKRAKSRRGFGKMKFRYHNNFARNRSSRYDLFQQWINIKQEYRIIVMWNGKRFVIPMIYKKIVKDRNSTRPIFHPNWEFKRVNREEVPEDIRQKAIEAIKRVKLHIVGVDAVEAEEGNFIIEVNSAPGLGEYSLKKLIKIFDNLKGGVKVYD